MNKVTMQDDLFLNELKSISVFQNMAEDDLKAISKFSSIVSYDAGEEIIEEGKSNTGFCILISGKVEIARRRNSKDYRLAILKSPSIFGETGLFKNELTTACVKSINSTVVLVISREQFSSFIDSHPKAGNIILTYIVLGLLEKLKLNNDERLEEQNLEFSPEDVAVLQSLFNGKLEK